MMVRVAPAAAAFMLLTANATHAGERDQLDACKAVVARSQQTGTTQDDSTLAKCRQIIREWTLRDSRRSVDEDGRLLR
jgi:hypothetical protein